MGSILKQFKPPFQLIFCIFGVFGNLVTKVDHSKNLKSIIHIKNFFSHLGALVLTKTKYFSAF